MPVSKRQLRDELAWQDSQESRDGNCMATEGQLAVYSLKGHKGPFRVGLVLRTTERGLVTIIEHIDESLVAFAGNYNAKRWIVNCELTKSPREVLLAIGDMKTDELIDMENAIRPFKAEKSE
jgi:hypothetical protein